MGKFDKNMIIGKKMFFSKIFFEYLKVFYKESKDIKKRSVNNIKNINIFKKILQEKIEYYGNIINNFEDKHILEELYLELGGKNIFQKIDLLSTIHGGLNFSIYSLFKYNGKLESKGLGMLNLIFEEEIREHFLTKEHNIFFSSTIEFSRIVNYILTDSYLIERFDSFLNKTDIVKFSKYFGFVFDYFIQLEKEIEKNKNQYKKNVIGEFQDSNVLKLLKLFNKKYGKFSLGIQFKKSFNTKYQFLGFDYYNFIVGVDKRLGDSIYGNSEESKYSLPYTFSRIRFSRFELSNSDCEYSSANDVIGEKFYRFITKENFIHQMQKISCFLNKENNYFQKILKMKRKDEKTEKKSEGRSVYEIKLLDYENMISTLILYGHFFYFIFNDHFQILIHENFKKDFFEFEQEYKNVFSLLISNISEIKKELHGTYEKYFDNYFFSVQQRGSEMVEFFKLSKLNKTLDFNELKYYTDQSNFFYSYILLALRYHIAYQEIKKLYTKDGKTVSTLQKNDYKNFILNTKKNLTNFSENIKKLETYSKENNDIISDFIKENINFKQHLGNLNFLIKYFNSYEN